MKKTFLYAFLLLSLTVGQVRPEEQTTTVSVTADLTGITISDPKDKEVYIGLRGIRFSTATKEVRMGLLWPEFYMGSRPVPAHQKCDVEFNPFPLSHSAGSKMLANEYAKAHAEHLKHQKLESEKAQANSSLQAKITGAAAGAIIGLATGNAYFYAENKMNATVEGSEERTLAWRTKGSSPLAASYIDRVYLEHEGAFMHNGDLWRRSPDTGQVLVLRNFGLSTSSGSFTNGIYNYCRMIDLVAAGFKGRRSFCQTSLLAAEHYAREAAVMIATDKLQQHNIPCNTTWARSTAFVASLVKITKTSNKNGVGITLSIPFLNKD